MISRLTRFLVLLAAVQILGGHWAVLQSVAWARMIVDYAQSESLSVAVAKTFDGAHPCALCETVSEGRQQEQKQEAQVVVVKLDAVVPARAELPARFVADWSFGRSVEEAGRRVVAPPTPPPLA